ncbi:MAG TPA: four helix bundle protein [Saprospiraceae bacterium]
MRRHNFKELLIWQLGMEIVDDIYHITKGFPKEEQFGLTLQMRKSSSSVPTNITEGCGRGTDPQLIYFLDISQGSAYELETQCYISLRQGYCLPSEMDPILVKIDEEQKMIDGFRSRFF